MTATVAGPSMSAATLGWPPWPSIGVAAVGRRSWTRISGNPASSSRSWHDRPQDVPRLQGRSRGGAEHPAFVLAAVPHRRREPPPQPGAGRLGLRPHQPLPHHALEASVTARASAGGSTSAQRVPCNSPRRIPVVAARTEWGSRQSPCAAATNPVPAGPVPRCGEGPAEFDRERARPDRVPCDAAAGHNSLWLRWGWVRETEAMSTSPWGDVPAHVSHPRIAPLRNDARDGDQRRSHAG